MATPDDVAVAESAQKASFAFNSKWTSMGRGSEFRDRWPRCCRARTWHGAAGLQQQLGPRDRDAGRVPALAPDDGTRRRSGIVAESVSTAAVAEFLYREARLLDARKFGEWLDLFCEDAVFWAPSVGMDGAYTTDPETSLNFIYIVGRAGLEARVFRVESGGIARVQSAAAHAASGHQRGGRRRRAGGGARPSPTPRSSRSARRAGSRSSMAPTSMFCARRTAVCASRERKYCCWNT